MDPIKVLANQAHSGNLYKNLRTKVMKCCAKIYFNLQCLNATLIDNKLVVLTELTLGILSENTSGWLQ